MFNSMLNRSAAVESASKHLKEMLPIEGAPLVEEHFLLDGVWQITLSYIPSQVHPNGASLPKEYKSFAIDGRSGEILSMKIRTPKS
jgi:hypothetical protein